MTTTFERLCVHDVELVEPTYSFDRYGDSVPDYGNPASLVTEQGWFTDVQTDEMAQGREAVTNECELSLPASSTINEHQRVRYAGDEYEIRGSIQRAHTPDGPHHLVARLRRVSG